MKNEIKTLCLVLATGLGISAAGCNGDKTANAPIDVEALRVELKEKVANGEMTMEEAQVQIAVATKEAKFQTIKKKPSGLDALGAELKKQVNDGDLTADEAKAKWTAAAVEAKSDDEEKMESKDAK